MSGTETLEACAGADGPAPAADSAAGAARRRSLDVLYGAGAGDAVGAARVLVVGAGGVGCELVKALGVAGFRNATLVDMDTVDVSNLNRQFLFRRQHVGLPKADVAATSATAMVPDLLAEGLVGNVKEARFGADFVRGFSVVLNALDNLDARRHMNRMCLSTGTPLVESGSTGYNGQVTVIGRGYECYDCSPKPPQKTYAVCTIRSTPDKPVHCIVWAKHLWDLLFGPEDESNVLRDLDGGGGEDAANGSSTVRSEDVEDTGASGGTVGENGVDKATSSNDTHADGGKRTPLRLQKGEQPDAFARRVAARVFDSDVSDQAAMKGLWAKDGRTPPVPYELPADAMPKDLSTVDLLENRVWSADESASVLLAVVEKIASERSAEIGTLSFDKDDNDALAFVVASSNLRSMSYGVELQSPFSVKGIAGNIVHAIATTNAMVAGLVVLEAIKIVVAGGVSPPETKHAVETNGDKAHRSHRKCYPSLTTYVRKVPSGVAGRRRSLLCSEPLQNPNPACYVCSKGLLPLSIDVDSWTLSVLVSSLCKNRLGTIEPTITVTSGDFTNTLYECGDGLEEDEVELYESNLGKTLRELRVESGSHIGIDDVRQCLSCSLVVKHCPGLLNELPLSDRYLVEGAVPEARPNGVPGGVGGNAQSSPQGATPDDDDILEVDVDGKEVSLTGVKRPRETTEADEPAKKMKSSDNEPIVIVD